jgi:hypothetical protein
VRFRRELPVLEFKVQYPAGALLSVPPAASGHHHREPQEA